MSSADFIIYTPGIGTLFYTVSSPLGKIQRIFCSIPCISLKLQQFQTLVKLEKGRLFTPIYWFLKLLKTPVGNGKVHQSVYNPKGTTDLTKSCTRYCRFFFNSQLLLD